MIFSTIDYAVIPFRQFYIGLNFIVIFIAFEITYVFFIKGIEIRREKIGRVNLAVALGFFTIAVNFILKMIHRLVEFDPVIYQKVLYLSAAGTALAIVLIVEPMIHKQRLYTIMAAIMFALYLFIDPSSPYIWIAVIWTTSLLLVPIHFIYYILKNVGKQFKSRLYLLTAFVVVLYLGLILNLEKNIEFVGEYWFVYVSFFMIISSLTGIYFTFKEIDFFIESGWRNHVFELYIIHKDTYQPLYYQNLQKYRNEKKNNRLDENTDNIADLQNQHPLFSGGLVGVDRLTKEITESKSSKNRGLSLIKLENKFLIIEHGEEALFCFVTDKNLDSLRFFLRQIRDAWRKYYSSTLHKIDDVEKETFTVMRKLVSNILSRRDVSWLNMVMGRW